MKRACQYHQNATKQDIVDRPHFINDLLGVYEYGARVIAAHTGVIAAVAVTVRRVAVGRFRVQRIGKLSKAKHFPLDGISRLAVLDQTNDSTHTR